MPDIRFLEKSEFRDGFTLFCNAMDFPKEYVDTMLESANFYHEKGILTLIGLFENDAIEGFGSIVFHHDPNNNWINWVGINPQNQGKGYGKIVMNTLLKMLENKGRKTVELCATNAGYPLYEKLGFKYEYNTDILKVKGSKDFQVHNNDELIIQSISNGDPVPDWIIELDKMNMGVERSEYLGYHFSEEYVIIGVKDKGYGMVTSKRVGPLISKSEELAQNIFQSSLDIGIETVIPVELPGRKSFMWDMAELEMWVPCRKMTYGPLPGQNYENLYAIRSSALG